MKVLGLTGGPNRAHDEQRRIPHFDGYWHDAAAALVVDGRVVNAYEEERLSRVKHTNKFPSLAARACLADAGLSVADLDMVAVYFRESYWEREIDTFRLWEPSFPVLAPRERLCELIGEACDGELDPAALRFVDHHHCHATSVLDQSGLQDALVLTLDGAGDNEAGRLLDVQGTRSSTLWTVGLNNSLGGMYLHVTRHLGYGQFDEYKVMGLAPYGDPDAFDTKLNMVSLRPEGRFEVDWGFAAQLRELCPARRRNEPASQAHRDLAAALQVSLERAVLHVLHHARHQTGQRSLCFAGGVAHNASLNGRILASSMFDDVFVHPASQDSGCAVGAALAVDPPPTGRHRAARRIRHAYWGTPIDAVGGRTEQAVRRWRDLVDGPVLAPDTREAVLARHLFDGAVIGVADGRAEFGPRALGNRSILADPRPVANRNRINKMIKKRETYRPFAPVVTAEDAHRYFDLPRHVRDSAFMSFAVPVRPQWRDALGAVTHVDGTARVQTVDEEQSPRLWRLLRRFAELSGMPILLNTSFNLSAEPIVDSPDDAIACLLTSGLSYLALGDHLLSCRPDPQYDSLTVQLPLDTMVTHRVESLHGNRAMVHLIERGGPVRDSRRVSTRCAALLQQTEPIASLGRLLAQLPDHEARTSVRAEIVELWRQRFVALRPADPAK